jgi:hypothetical protein
MQQRNLPTAYCILLTDAHSGLKRPAAQENPWLRPKTSIGFLVPIYYNNREIAIQTLSPSVESSRIIP